MHTFELKHFMDVNHFHLPEFNIEFELSKLNQQVKDFLHHESLTDLLVLVSFLIIISHLFAQSVIGYNYCSGFEYFQFINQGWIGI